MTKITVINTKVPTAVMHVGAVISPGNGDWLIKTDIAADIRGNVVFINIRDGTFSTFYGKRLFDPHKISDISLSGINHTDPDEVVKAGSIVRFHGYSEIFIKTDNNNCISADMPEYVSLDTGIAIKTAVSDIYVYDAEIEIN